MSLEVGVGDMTGTLRGKFSFYAQDGGHLRFFIILNNLLRFQVHKTSNV